MKKEREIDHAKFSQRNVYLHVPSSRSSTVVTFSSKLGIRAALPEVSNSPHVLPEWVPETLIVRPELIRVLMCRYESLGRKT